MIDAVLPAFYVAKQHSSVTFLAFFVPKAVDFEPVFRAHLAFADFTPNLFVKYLRSAARHAIHAVFEHLFYDFFVAKAVFSREEINLRRS